MVSRQDRRPVRRLRVLVWSGLRRLLARPAGGRPTRRSSGVPPGPGGRRLIPLIIVALLLFYGAGSAAYLSVYRLDRDPNLISVCLPVELAREGERLARGFSAATGHSVIMVDPESLDPGELLRSGSIDCALIPVSEEPPQAEPAPGVPALYHATLLAVPFPSVPVSISLDEARRLVSDVSAGAAPGGDYSRVQLITMADRAPDRQLLEVGGVYPTLSTVTGGSYPLVTELRLYVRPCPAGPLGLAARLPRVRSWLQPNDHVIREFAGWLAGHGGRDAFYGTPLEVQLTAVGDVWFARNVGVAIDEHGLDYPFELVGERLRAGDITWCSLEAPLTTAETALPGKALWFRAKPETVACLEKAGIDVVALANNHILDYDSPGLVETLDILDRAGIVYCGAGRDMAEARSAAIVEVNGLKVAFLAYTEFADPGLWWDETYRRTFMAGDGIPGCAPLDMAVVAEDIERTRREADLIVVGYHWGREDEPYPLRYDAKNDLDSIARHTIDLGVCLVLGTHPHAVQGFEHHRGGLIAYSLGNFVADQKRDTQREGLILEVQLGPSGVLSARIVPIWIEGHRPQIMEGEEALRLLEWVEIISIPLNSPGWKN